MYVYMCMECVKGTQEKEIQKTERYLGDNQFKNYKHRNMGVRKERTLKQYKIERRLNQKENEYLFLYSLTLRPQVITLCGGGTATPGGSRY